MTGLMALGDSFTCGEGVGVRVPLDQTWTGLLAGALTDQTRVSLASPGARVRDVVREQLPQVRDAAIATLLIGLNDVARAGFDIAALHTDLLKAVARLCANADTVLLGRLHDPVRMLWVPEPLRRKARERVRDVNAVIDEAAAYPRVHLVDLDSIPELRQRSGWAVDRVHPSLSGHAAIARASADVLRRAGHTIGFTAPGPPPRDPTPLDRVWWLSRHGVPYAAKNLRCWGGEALA